MVKIKIERGVNPPPPPVKLDVEAIRSAMGQLLPGGTESFVLAFNGKNRQDGRTSVTMRLHRIAGAAGWRIRTKKEPGKVSAVRVWRVE